MLPWKVHVIYLWFSAGTLTTIKESTTLDDGDYELVPEPEPGFSEDPVNIAEDITEAPNPSSEVFDTTDPSPAQEGKPQCITQYFKLLHL
jgi:hypothetical protein